MPFCRLVRFRSLTSSAVGSLFSAFRTLREGDPLDASASSSRPNESTVALLTRVLTDSLDDGTPGGAAARRQYLQLNRVVCSILSHEHAIIGSRIRDVYSAHDPSALPASSSPATQADTAAAAALVGSLHSLLVSAGFNLCSRQQELVAASEHFGDESMWNVPVNMRWDALDGSLVVRELGGFDAYEAEARRGRAPERPIWAHKLVVYHRGSGTVEKRGYFIYGKIEEMALQRARCLSKRAIGSWRALIQAATLRVRRPQRSLGAQLVWMAERLGLRDCLSALLAETKSPPAAAGGGAGPWSTADFHKSVSVGGISGIELSWRALLEETTLRAPSYEHILLVYRHADAEREAHGNRSHVALGMFRNVPRSDLELLLPHAEARAPPVRLSVGSLPYHHPRSLPYRCACPRSSAPSSLPLV